MAGGQGVLTPTLDVGAVDAAQTRLEVLAVARCALHAQLLHEVLGLHRLFTTAGVTVSTVPQVALLLQLSDNASAALLAEAELLTSLPGGLEALQCGLLTVEQSAVLLRIVGGLDAPVQQAVWQRLQARLIAAADGGLVLPPARLAEHLNRWVIAADPAQADERRRRAEAAGDVTYRRREDGVGDLFATGIPAPLLQTVLHRIRQRSAAMGSQDPRSAGKRRLDALLDLLLGRDVLPSDADPEPSGEAGGSCHAAGGGRCACRPGTPVPCGTSVLVHVPLGAALGTTDELAELVGHGPLTPDQLAQVLRHSPHLRAVRVDEHGVPVSVDPQVWTPPPDDLTALQQTLLAMAAAPPGPTQPRHPYDHPHPPEAADGPDGAGPDTERPHGGTGDGGSVPAAADDRDRVHDRELTAPASWTGTAPEPTVRTPGHPPPPTPDVGQPETPDTRRPGTARPRARAGAHPAGTAGPYRLPAWLRRLVQVRAPRCEWPGCGARADRCDLDHDRAWPYGPTCACQCGPLCRHHHQVKQATMLKIRTEHSTLTWTDPTGRRWTSPAQHPAPASPTRALPTVPVDEPHNLSPDALTELLADPDDDPLRYELRAPETDPDQPDHDRLAERLHTDDGWGLALDDPHRWAA